MNQGLELRGNRLMLIIRNPFGYQEIDVTQLWNTFKEISEFEKPEDIDCSKTSVQEPVKGC